MSWFPNLLTKPESSLSAGAFRAVGKALHIANEFEATCKHVLQIGDMSSYIQAHEGASLLEAFNTIFKERFLRSAIKGLGSFTEINAKHIALLERQKTRGIIALMRALCFSLRLTIGLLLRD
jgi:hypothetical protein